MHPNENDLIQSMIGYADKVKELIADKKPLCHILTFGCQQNEADSERLASLALMMGYSLTDEAGDASLILVNTCAIRDHAEKKALSIIGQFKHIKDSKPSVIIGVGGCMVTQSHRADKLKNSYPYVNFTFDTGSLELLPKLVYEAVTEKKRQFIIRGEYELAEGLPLYRKAFFKAWLSIMYGCNNFCSYCIVPYVRGRERSREPDAVISEAQTLIKTGACDITLLGQNVNSYGSGRGDGVDIAALMHRICALDGDFRLRFMTSHPKDASDRLIEAVAGEAKIAKHFHLPVQSGSDAILAKMNRRYTAEKYLETISKLKRAYPDISITSDIIVGFPGESESDFEATLDMLRTVRYDMIFSFIYSPRDGTPAAKMEDRIPREVSNERFARLLELQNKISLERNRRFVGREIRVLAEEISRTDSSMLTCRGDSPRPVHVKGDASFIGQFLDVEITSADTFSLIGEIKK